MAEPKQGVVGLEKSLLINRLLLIDVHHVDIAMILEHVVDKRVDRTDLLQRHVIVFGPDKVRPKHYRQI